MHNINVLCKVIRSLTNLDFDDKSLIFVYYFNKMNVKTIVNNKIKSIVNGFKDEILLRIKKIKNYLSSRIRKTIDDYFFLLIKEKGLIDNLLLDLVYNKRVSKNLVIDIFNYLESNN